MIADAWSVFGYVIFYGLALGLAYMTYLALRSER